MIWERSNRSDELYHFGVKGQKWGVRRYQNKDGSLTPRGKKHQEEIASTLEYNSNFRKSIAKYNKESYNAAKKGLRGKMSDADLYTVGSLYLRNRKSELRDSLLAKAIRSNELKVGEDYISKTLKLGDNFYDKQFSESGKTKIKDVNKKADNIFKKENSKIIKEVESYKNKIDMNKINKDLNNSKKNYAKNPTAKTYNKIKRLEQIKYAIDNGF